MRAPVAMFVTRVHGGESFLLRELRALEAQGQPVMLVRTLLWEKIRDAAFVRTTTEFAKRFLESLFPQETAGKIRVVHIGAEKGVAAAACSATHRCGRSSPTAQRMELFAA